MENINKEIEEIKNEENKEEKLTWEKPVITKLDIKRTEFGPSGIFDGISFGT